MCANKTQLFKMENKSNPESLTTLLSDQSVDKLVNAFVAFTERDQVLAKEEQETFRELNRDKLSTVRRMDRDQMIFKAMIIVLCVLALCILALYDKLLGVSPVLGVIIGAVLGADNVGGFLASFRRGSIDED